MIYYLNIYSINVPCILTFILHLLLLNTNPRFTFLSHVLFHLYFASPHFNNLCYFQSVPDKWDTECQTNFEPIQNVFHSFIDCVIISYSLSWPPYCSTHFMFYYYLVFIITGAAYSVYSHYLKSPEAINLVPCKDEMNISMAFILKCIVDTDTFKNKAFNN